MYRSILTTLTAAAALAAGVSACGSTGSQQGAQPPSATAVAHRPARPAGTLSVLTEPQSGIGPI